MGWFDRFASATSTFVSRAPFFAACVILVIVWGPSYFVLGSVSNWQLVINTITTVVTFLLVALLQNTQERFEKTTNKKLNAIANFLADTANDPDSPGTKKNVQELRNAVGLEETQGA